MTVVYRAGGHTVEVEARGAWVHVTQGRENHWERKRWKIEAAGRWWTDESVHVPAIVAVVLTVVLAIPLSIVEGVWWVAPIPTLVGAILVPAVAYLSGVRRNVPKTIEEAIRRADKASRAESAARDAIRDAQDTARHYAEVARAIKAITEELDDDR